MVKKFPLEFRVRKFQSDIFMIRNLLFTAHPSCMNYSPELVHRITSDASAWQCIDCKACIICNDSGDPVSYFFKTVFKLEILPLMHAQYFFIGVWLITSDVGNR